MHTEVWYYFVIPQVASQSHFRKTYRSNRTVESVIPSWLVNIVRGERGHVILTQLATLAHSYSIFVRKEKYGRFPREVFDDTVTVLEFICETSKTSEALQAKRTFTRAIRVVSFPDRIFRARSVKSSLGTRLLSEPLSLDWETTPPAPAPPIPAIGEPHPSFAHANFAANAWEQKKCECETPSQFERFGEKIHCVLYRNEERLLWRGLNVLM